MRWNGIGVRKDEMESEKVGNKIEWEERVNPWTVCAPDVCDLNHFQEVEFIQPFLTSFSPWFNCITKQSSISFQWKIYTLLKFRSPESNNTFARFSNCELRDYWRKRNKRKVLFISLLIHFFLEYFPTPSFIRSFSLSEPVLIYVLSNHKGDYRGYKKRTAGYDW